MSILAGGLCLPQSISDEDFSQSEPLVAPLNRELTGNLQVSAALLQTRYFVDQISDSLRIQNAEPPLDHEREGGYQEGSRLAKGDGASRRLRYPRGLSTGDVVGNLGVVAIVPHTECI